MIYIGTNQLKALYVGTTPIKAVYVGTTLVWSSNVATYFLKDSVIDETLATWTFKRVYGGSSGMNYATPNFHMYSNALYGRGLFYSSPITLTNAMKHLHVNVRKGSESGTSNTTYSGFGIIPASVDVSSITINTNGVCTNTGAISHSALIPSATLADRSVDISSADRSQQYRIYVAHSATSSSRRDSYFPDIWVDSKCSDNDPSS